MRIEGIEREQRAIFDGEEVTAEIPMGTATALQRMRAIQGIRGIQAGNDRNGLNCSWTLNEDDNDSSFDPLQDDHDPISIRDPQDPKDPSDLKEMSEEWLEDDFSKENYGSSSNSNSDDSDSDSDATITNEKIVASLIVDELDEKEKPKPDSAPVPGCMEEAADIADKIEFPFEDIGKRKTRETPSPEATESPNSPRKYGSGLSLSTLQFQFQSHCHTLHPTEKVDSALTGTRRSLGNDCIGNLSVEGDRGDLESSTAPCSPWKSSDEDEDDEDEEEEEKDEDEGDIEEATVEDQEEYDSESETESEVELRNEWNGGIDLAFHHSLDLSSHGHAPGETGISTRIFLTTSSFHSFLPFPSPSPPSHEREEKPVEPRKTNANTHCHCHCSPHTRRRSRRRRGTGHGHGATHSIQDATSEHPLTPSSSFRRPPPKDPSKDQHPHGVRHPTPDRNRNLSQQTEPRTRPKTNSKDQQSYCECPQCQCSQECVTLECARCGPKRITCPVSIDGKSFAQLIFRCYAQSQSKLNKKTSLNQDKNALQSFALPITVQFQERLASFLRGSSLVNNTKERDVALLLFQYSSIPTLTPLFSTIHSNFSNCECKCECNNNNKNQGNNCVVQIQVSRQVLEGVLQDLNLMRIPGHPTISKSDPDFIDGILGRRGKNENESEDCPGESTEGFAENENEKLVNRIPSFFIHGQENQNQKQTEKGDTRISSLNFLLDISDNIAMQQRLCSSEHIRLRSVLRKPGHSKKQRGRSVTFNESLNLFYEAECSCWVHEDEYARLRQEEHDKREREELFHYEPPPIEFDDPPTLSPPEGYKDRFFPQEIPIDPDVTRVTPPSPPAARRKVFLKDNPIVNGQEDEEEPDDYRKNKTSRLGGILKGGRLWRSNSAEGKKVASPQEEPDVVKCTETSSVQQTPSEALVPLKVSTGTAPLRTSEQIRLAVDSTLRFRANKKKPECSSLVEKLRWLTSLDDDDSSDSNTSGFATWPSRDKNGTLTKSTGGGTGKADAGTSTTEEFVQSAIIRQPPINTANEAKIKQISYTLEDIDEGLKSGENELESFITEDGGRIERLRKRYGDDIGGDDYGFSRRPSVKGIKPKFSSTNQIFAQFTMRKSETPIPPVESQYENHNSRGLTQTSMDPAIGNNPNVNPNPNSMALLDNARILNYEFANAPGRQSEESRAHFEMIRQSFEPGAYVNFSRPHSWSVSTLPHPHHAHHAHSHSHSMCIMQPPQQINNLPNNSTTGACPGPTNGPPNGPGSIPGSNSGSGPCSGPGSGPGSNAGAGAGAGSMIPNNILPVNSPPMNPQHQQQQSGPVPSSVSIMAATSHLPQSQYATMVNNGGMGVSHNIYGSNTNGGSNAGIYGTLPHQHQMNNAQQGIYGTLQNNLNGPGMGQCPGGVGGGGGSVNMGVGVGIGGGLGNHSSNLQQQQQMYGTVRRVPNVIGRPLFLHYGALSVEAHPNKISYPRNQVPETPSPTQQPPPIRYYGPPIRYYNPPPPVPPRTAASAPSASAAIAGAVVNLPLNCTQGNKPNPNSMINAADHERGVPEGATDEEPGVKEPYSMNI